MGISAPHHAGIVSRYGAVSYPESITTTSIRSCYFLAISVVWHLLNTLLPSSSDFTSSAKSIPYISVMHLQNSVLGPFPSCYISLNYVILFTVLEIRCIHSVKCTPLSRSLTPNLLDITIRLSLRPESSHSISFPQKPVLLFFLVINDNCIQITVQLKKNLKALLYSLLAYAICLLSLNDHQILLILLLNSIFCLPTFQNTAHSKTYPYLLEIPLKIARVIFKK